MMWIDLAKNVERVMTDSASVIIQRTHSFAAGTMSKEEAQEMMTEKPWAFADSIRSASFAAMQGGTPFFVAERAMEPIRIKTSDNAHRLNPKV